MQLDVKVTPNTIAKIDVDTDIELFKEMSKLANIFQHNQCGCCKSENIRFLHRVDKDENDWYELSCNECFAKLPFGANKGKGQTLYAKNTWNSLSEEQQKQRADEESKCKNGYLPNKGWFKFQKKD